MAHLRYNGNMNRQQIIQFIKSISPLPRPFDELESEIKTFSLEDIKFALWGCGVIPESFDPSSSEEKLWAKYCDILLALSLTHLDIPSKVIRTRGDSADVLGEANQYSIVGDAKAFRLSRTAKNQKDFKITALDDWRKSNTYACLVAPLLQYPNQNSQIYQQASQRNVTLLSYTHLAFLLEYPTSNLVPLWQCAGNLKSSQQAQPYWQAIDEAVLTITQQESDTLKDYKNHVATHTLELAQEGIIYWQEVALSYQQLSHSQAIARLIKAEKIDQKLIEINRIKVRIEQHYGTIS